MLEIEDSHIKSVSDLREGDCIVAFGRERLFTLQKIINRVEANKRKQKRQEQKEAAEAEYNHTTKGVRKEAKKQTLMSKAMEQVMA